MNSPGTNGNPMCKRGACNQDQFLAYASGYDGIRTGAFVWRRQLRLSWRLVWFLSVGMCALWASANDGLAADSPAGHVFLQEHCIQCHDSGTTEGGLNLEDLNIKPADPVNLATWAKVYDRIASGEMPPEDEERPDPQDLQAFSRLTASALSAAWKLRYETHGRVGGRRLNPVEYETTLRDLLAAPWLELKEMLPPDPELHGFDNVAEAQEISYVQLSRYLEAAEVAIDGAMRLRPAPKPTTARTWFIEEGRYLGKDWKERYGSVDDEGYHTVSHHGQNREKIAQLAIIEEEHVKQLSKLLAKLKNTREDGDSLLDRTMVLYGSNLGNASSHDNRNMPMILAGGGFKHGQHLGFDTTNNYPVSNLYVSMLQRLGIEADRFASSTGTIRGLEL